MSSLSISADWHPLQKASQDSPGSYSCYTNTPLSQTDQMNSILAALTFALWTPTIPTEELSRILPAWRYGGKTNLSVCWLPAVVAG